MSKKNILIFANKIIKLLMKFIFIGFIFGFAFSFYQIISNRYMQNKMFRLVALSFQKNLNKWIVLSILIYFILVIAYIILLFIIKKAWKFLPLYLKETIGENKSKFALIILSCSIFVICWGYVVNHYLIPYRKFHPLSILIDVGIVIVAFFFGWILMKLKWNLEYNPPIIRKSVIALILLQIFLNLFTKVDQKINVPNGPNIIWICIDALRADHLGCYGYNRSTSPFMDYLATNSIIFKKHISQSSWTKTSVATFMTGSYSTAYRVLDEEDRLPSNINTLAEILRNHGYSTGAFIANPWLKRRFGFDQGFEHYNYQGNEPEYRINEKALFKYIDKYRKNKFFLYIHFMDVHNPYSPPPPYNRKFITEMGNYRYKDGFVPSINKKDLDYTVGLYDGEIRFLDDKIKKLFNYLRKQGILHETLVIINSDHGDEFFEHHGMGHGTTLYNELLHVPFIMVANDILNIKNSTINVMTRNIDILPTILDQLNISPRKEIDGVSLLPLFTKEEKVSFSEFSHALVKSQETKDLLTCIFKDEYKYIYNFNKKRGELYDIKNDFKDEKNLAELDHKMSVKMQNETLNLTLNYLKREFLSRSRTSLDKKTIEELRSLGYIR